MVLGGVNPAILFDHTRVVSKLNFFIFEVIANANFGQF